MDILEFFYRKVNNLTINNNLYNNDSIKNFYTLIAF